MIEVIPAILPASLEDLSHRLALVRGLSSWVQIDGVDGRFAPSLTWPYNDRQGFQRILREEEGLPFWEEFNFEIDLMTTQSLRDAKDWVRAGAGRIIIHLESPDASEALNELQGYRESIDVGVALSIETPLERLDAHEGMLDFVQLMGIARIGKQGEPLDERIFGKIRALREKREELTIQIDGGVSQGSARALAEAGATRLVAGSALFKAEDIEQAYDALSGA